MEDKNLFKRLSALGFSMLETEELQDTNKTLADVVKSRNLRLWEGFPVVLVNSAEKGLLNYNKVNSYLKKLPDKDYLASLMIMSLSLYKVLNLKFSWADKIYKSLSGKRKKEFKSYFKKLKMNEDLQVGNYLMSSQRLRTTFNNYFSKRESGFNELLLVKEEHRLEYMLSQVFSPKQKELFLKKLKREKLTKTEREYFSRVVKKKVLALANSELHRLSQHLIQGA